MNKYKIIVYIRAGLLIYTALTMITEDNYTAKYITQTASRLISFLAGLAVVAFGTYKIRREAKMYKEIEEEVMEKNEEIQLDSIDNVMAK